ncbi:MAG: ketoacyl-ACP synthase III [Candidatus Marinimicrobia bacterium]|nr:ketoacyl-ACP synthase III [Candidatus Neomarinimicrobiota bacterium]
MSKKRAVISAFGKYAPKRVLTNSDLEKMVDTTDAWIRTRTGIVERHIVAEGEATSQMSIQAFADMQKRFPIDPEEIDLIVVATVTPDMFFPSTAALIQNGIGAKSAFGFDVSAACSGFLYALVIATQFIENGQYKKILVFGADTMSSIADYTNRDTCVLFGDGAGVVLLEAADDNGTSGIFDHILKMDGAGKDFLYMLGGGSLHPATHETVDQKMHYVYQEGKTVFKFAVSRMAAVSEELLNRNSLTGKDIAIFIPHQANKRIIDACVDRMNLKPEQVLLNIDRYGNTTSATIPIGLVESYDDGRIKEGDIVLFSAFGAGFTWGSILIRWGHLRHA